MPAKQIIIFDPQSNEYLYDLFAGLPRHSKEGLNASELAQIRNSSRIKKFVNNTILDKKLVHFTKTGMDWALVFFDPNIFDFADLEQVYKQYASEGLPVENMNKMLREKTFVITGKEVALGLSLMASNCHSQSYTINRNFLRTREATRHIANISKNAERNQNVEFLKAQSSIRTTARMLWASLMLESYLESAQGLTRCDALILILLFQKPHNFFRVDVIQRKLGVEFKPTSVATRARKLFEAGYLEKLPTAAKKPAYQIKAKGILALSDLLNRIVNDTENEL